MVMPSFASDALDRRGWMRRRSGRLAAQPLKLLGLACAAALLFRTFGYEAFNIPSGSMMPTLIAGDEVIVSKLSYGLSRYSLPFWHPDIAGRLFGRSPVRGDVVVFKLPSNPDEDYIKRVIGLPGDRVQMIGGLLYINGVQVPAERVGDFLDPADGIKDRMPQLVETLPAGISHPMLNTREHATTDQSPVWVVPMGHVFVMGDNRDVSEDSRAMDTVGFVPLDNLVGRAELRLFSLGDRTPWWQLWKWPSALRRARVLTRIE